MIFEAEGLVLVLLVLFWVWALIDVIATDESEIRNLPKLLWLLIVLVLPDLGSLIWLLLGRPQHAGFWPGGSGASTARRQAGYKSTGPYGRDSAPRYLAEYDMSDRRSAELDEMLDRQLQSSGRDLGEWEAELTRREQELKRRELEARERELAERERSTTDDV